MSILLPAATKRMPDRLTFTILISESSFHVALSGPIQPVLLFFRTTGSES
jgi:hypothetical protein